MASAQGTSKVKNLDFVSMLVDTKFDHEMTLGWMARNWTLSVWISAAYLLFIYFAHKYMRSRPKFNLRGPLLVWNLILAVFSVVGLYHMLPEVTSSLRQFGLTHSVCNPRFFTGTPGFWAWLFALSKFPELGDTVFIVFRKQPLHFLHWYHHVTVLCYSWYSYGGHTAPGRWFITMNYLVHSIMYSYYALKAIRMRIPKQVSMLITGLQLAQMAVGCFINFWGYRVKALGGQCNVTNENLCVSLIMYLSYFSLFVHFFYNAYLTKKKPRADLEKQE